MKRILITGENSYIGTKFKGYMSQWPEDYEVTEISVRGNEWKEHDFSRYDIVFHVAGIAHQKETRRNRKDYFNINRDLAFEVAQHSKKYGVSQFVFLSSMSVYGMKTGVITKETVPNPKSAYGQSKLEAELLIQNLNDDQFTVTILRPPMVYGPGCKGNYQTLSKFAKVTPIFPNFPNKRSMIFIDNLSNYVKCTIDLKQEGIHFPQNKEYVSTVDLVRTIADLHNHRLYTFKILNIFLEKLISLSFISKVFGSLYYKSSTKNCDCIDFRASVIVSEGLE